MSKPILLILIAFFASALCFGQIGSPNSKTESANKNSEDIFSSVEGRFSIALPEQIDSLNVVNGVTFGWKLSEGTYRVGYIDKATDFENSANFESESEAVAKEIFEMLYVPDNMRSGFDRKKITFAGHKGIEMKIKIPSGGLCIVRVFWVKARAYRLGVLLYGNEAREADALKVFNSLKLIPEKEAEAVIRKRIEEMTPKPLPQTPAAKKPTSDAQDENLKGKVKTVITEIQYIEGVKKGGAKIRTGEVEYNEQGYQLKKVFYRWDGIPSGISVFGYIDGNRVSRSSQSDDSVGIGGIGSSVNTKPRDARYNLKYVYTYNEKGELSEKAMFYNDGSPGWKTVFVRSKNQLEEYLYGSEGLYRKSVLKLDAAGNEIERITEHPSASVSTEIITTTYDKFDAKGNWTKKTSTVWSATGNSKTLVESYVNYRTITYYR